MDGFLVGRVRGIDLRVNWSILIIGGLIAWSLADAVLPDVVEGRSDTAYWVTGALTALALLAALAAHELGHSLVALRHGVAVEGITLWMLGGVAVLGSNPATPSAALRIAAAGPAVSAGLGVAGFVLSIPATGLLGAALQWFGVMNLVLAVFNLLPAFPLDGGRIYQAWQWRVTGHELDATQRAAKLGQTIGAMLVGLGVVELLFQSFVGGLWLMVIGLFIREAARAQWREAALERPLAGLTVRQVMSPDPLTVRGDITIDNFVAGVFFGGRHAAYPVVDADGAVTGLITLNAVRALGDHDVLDVRTVADVAGPISDVTVVEPELSARDLVRELAVTGDARALVMTPEGELVGIVSPTDVARLVSVLELANATRSTQHRAAA